MCHSSQKGQPPPFINNPHPRTPHIIGYAPIFRIFVLFKLSHERKELSKLTKKHFPCFTSALF